MRYAFVCDAGAACAGQPRYSLHIRNNGFNHGNLQLDVNEAHELGKKFYAVVSIAPHNAKLKASIRDLRPVVGTGPGTPIMSDPGLIMLVHKNSPDMDTHLSVQVSTVNWATVRFWKQMGLTRIILSRKLSLKEIEEIRTQVPDVELKIFVHDTLCMTYSGRCLLSGYINKRDLNQGTCTNACRWEYNVQEGKENVVNNIAHKYRPIPIRNVEPTLNIGAPTGKVFMIKETQCPGGYMTAFEDEHDTYIMNSKDLRAIAHVERLTQMGVHPLEIEGHTESYYYCTRTAQVCRKAIDDAAAGKPFDPQLLETLESLAHRGYIEGFLRRHTHNDYQNHGYGFSVSERQQFVGELISERKGELAAVLVKNKFAVGNSLKLMTPQDNINLTLEQLKNAKGEVIPVAPGGGYTVWIPVPEDIDLNYALLIRNFTGESTRNPHAKQLIAVIFQRSEDSQRSITCRFVH